MHAEYRWVLAQLRRPGRARRRRHRHAAGVLRRRRRRALAGHAERGGYDDGLPDELATPGYGVRPEFDHDFAFQFGLPYVLDRRRQRRRRGRRARARAVLRPALRQRRGQVTTAAPKLGLPAEYGMSWMLPRLVGVTRATDLLLSGRVVTGAETADWGLWNGVVADGEATLAAARRYAADLATTVGPAPAAHDEAADLRRPAAPRRRRLARRARAPARRGDGAPPSTARASPPSANADRRVLTGRRYGVHSYGRGGRTGDEGWRANGGGTARHARRARRDRWRADIAVAGWPPSGPAPSTPPPPASTPSTRRCPGSSSLTAAAQLVAGLRRAASAAAALAATAACRQRRRGQRLVRHADHRDLVDRRASSTPRHHSSPTPPAPCSARSPRSRAVVALPAARPPRPRAEPASAPGVALGALTRGRDDDRRDRTCTATATDGRPHPRRRRASTAQDAATVERAHAHAEPTAGHVHETTGTGATTDRRRRSRPTTTAAAHEHPDAATWPRPWDPTAADRLLRRPGVTAEQQERAEALAASTLADLPQFADVPTLAALGYRSIGDASTGYEHYINAGYIGDDGFLDPDAARVARLPRRRRAAHAGLGDVHRQGPPSRRSRARRLRRAADAVARPRQPLLGARRRRQAQGRRRHRRRRQLRTRLGQRRRRQPHGPRVDRPPRVRSVRRAGGPRRRPGGAPTAPRADQCAHDHAAADHRRPGGHGGATTRRKPIDLSGVAGRHARAAGVRREPRRRHARPTCRSGPTPAVAEAAGFRSIGDAGDGPRALHQLGLDQRRRVARPRRTRRASSTSRSPTARRSWSRRCTCCPHDRSPSPTSPTRAAR